MNTTIAIAPTAAESCAELKATPLEAARRLTRLGFRVVPIPFKAKGPKVPGWQDLRLGDEDLPTHFNGSPANIGVLLGEPSAGLVDVDLDSAHARALAPIFLPPTGMIFGRAGSPKSHWIYRITDQVPRRCPFVCPDGEMIVEVRGTGHQTVFPGSTHTSGEAILFESEGEPCSCTFGTLDAAVRLLAAGALLASRWPAEGSRHSVSLALAGALLRGGWDIDKAEKFIRDVASAAGDEEAEDRGRSVRSTAERLNVDGTATGVPKLKEALGPKVVQRLIEWLELSEARPTPDCEYFVNETGTWRLKPTRDGPIPEKLANFSATITGETIEDDGAEQHRTVDLEVRGLAGDPTLLTLAADEFGGMQWPLRHLGTRAIVEPGTLKPSYLRCAIQSLSSKTTVRTVYSHTGWTKIGDQHVYLHAGGAIGTNGTCVDILTQLPPGMERYVLPEPPQAEELEIAMRVMLGVLKLGPARVMFPLLAAVARAVLGQVDFSLFLVGQTGAFKSETASIIQRFFGAGFDARHLPGSWSSTGNALEEQAFRAKDAILVVDDFKPSGGAADAQLHALADRVFRAQGNGAGRQRMTAELQLRAQRPPRGLILATGEELPAGESLRARLLVLDVAPGDIQVDRLTRLQQQAAAGLLSQATSALVAWCAPQLERLRQELRDQSATRRTRYLGGHARTAGVLAELDVAMEILLRCICEVTQELVLTRSEAGAVLEECRASFREILETQQAEVAAADPVRSYLELLAAAISSGKAHIIGSDGAAPELPESWGWRVEGGVIRPSGLCIGWRYGENLYLNPAAAYQVATALDTGVRRITVAMRTLHRRMFERGMLLSREPSRNTYTKRIDRGGRRQSYLHVSTSALDGVTAMPPATEGAA